MKLLNISGLIILLALSQTAIAEPGRGGDRDARHTRHMDRLIEDLQLSSEQEPQVRQILEEQHTKLKSEMKAIREQAEPRMQALKEETNQRLSGVLNEEQLNTFNANMDKHKKRKHDWKKRKHGKDKSEE